MGKNIKVPVIMQMEALECGAACLCMIAAYYKKWIPLTKVREDCGVSRDGSVAKNMLNAGRNYGFEANGYRLEPSNLNELTLPAIIHWDFNHFVVLCGVNERKGVVYITDPARGRVTVSMEEFDKSFTGIAITFVPTPEFKPEGKQKSVLGFAKRCLRGALVPFILAVILNIIAAIMRLTSPISTKIFTDNLISGKNPEWLMPFIGILFAIMIIQVLVEIINSFYWLKIQGKFAIMSSSEFMWHVLRLPLKFFSQRYTADVVARQESTSNIALILIQKMAPILTNVAAMVIYFMLMIQYSWVLTLIGIGASLINMGIINITSKRMLDLQRGAASTQGKLMNTTYSGFEMIETIKSTGAESGYFERWAGFYARQNNSAVKIAKLTQYLGKIPGFIETFANLFLQLAGIYLIIEGKFTIGSLMAFQGFLGGFLGPMREFMGIYEQFVTMRCDMERVEDVLDYPTDVEGTISTEYKEDEKLKGNLEVKNLTFGYSKLAPPLLKNFNLSLKSGSWVALVGASGSGKSTVAKLLMGLYEPWEGEVLFDGKKKSELDSYKFHNSISMVDQEKIMFHDTIKNNIRMWDDSIEDFAVVMAAKDSDIHDIIISRPDGYNHVMNEGGKDFSGGQCQRIEIARALAQEPTIVILDEATSALDAKTEELVMKNVKNQGCTCVVVAHRLSTVRDCDEILVFDKGVVVERGTHNELMEKGGLYKELIITE